MISRLGISLSAALVIGCSPAFAGEAPAPVLAGWVDAIWGIISAPAAVSGIVGLIMALVPQGSPGTAWGGVRALLDFVAMNWGNAKNAPPSAKT